MNYLALSAGIVVVGAVCFGWGWLARHEAQCERERLARLRATVNRELGRQERVEWLEAQAQFESESG